jgi:rhodanese-related sulfurtransferase
VSDAPTPEEMRALQARLKHVRCVELTAWLAEGRPCSVLDVRTEEEFHARHIPGATLVPLHELEARVDEVLSLPGPLVVHCEHGVRSVQASLFLLWEGRDDVHNLAEGLAAWSGPTAHGRSSP